MELEHSPVRNDMLLTDIPEVLYCHTGLHNFKQNF